MRNADPRVKLLWVLLITTAALIFKRPCWLFGLGLFTLAGILFFGADSRSLRLRLGRFLPLLFFIALIHALFSGTGRPLLVFNGFVFVTWEGLLRGITTMLRFFVILAAAAVMAAEENRRVIAALNQMGIPYLFSFLLTTALRFLPTFGQAFSQSLTAIQLRGVQLEKLLLRQKLSLYSYLFLPVVADSVGRAKMLAAVMEARGFGAFKKRTYYTQVRLSCFDWLLLVILTSTGILAFTCYYFY